MTKPLTPEEEVEIRQADALCHRCSEYENPDYARLLATLDAERARLAALIEGSDPASPATATEPEIDPASPEPPWGSMTQAERYAAWHAEVCARDAHGCMCSCHEGYEPVATPVAGSTILPLDVERLGFTDLLAIGRALLEHYPPDTIVCSHSIKADIGARTAAAISDLIDSCAARLAGSTETVIEEPNWRKVHEEAGGDGHTGEYE